MKNNIHHHNLSFIDNIILATDIKDSKEILNDFLLEYFECQDKKGVFTPEHRHKVLFNFKLMSSLLDHLHEIQINRVKIK